MLTRKCLGTTSLVALGLFAACSSDSTSSPKDDIAEVIDNTLSNTSACIYDGYTAMQGANGETLCLDAEGTLAFWINTDGTYGFPEATQAESNGTGATDAGSTEASEATDPNSSAASTEDSSEPSTPSTGEPTISSSSSVTGCTTDKALYAINGVSYYRDASGNLYLRRVRTRMCAMSWMMCSTVSGFALFSSIAISLRLRTMQNCKKSLVETTARSAG